MHIIPPGVLENGEYAPEKASQAPENTYDGEWDQDKRNGMGECVFSSGDHYVGDWCDNVIQGHGNMYYYGGAKYQGCWENGQRLGIL